MNSTRRFGALLGGLFMLVLFAFPAAAQAPYPGGTGVQCDSTLVAPGGSLTCQIDACAPGVAINGTAEFDTDDGAGATVTATGTADSDGKGGVTFAVPGNATGGIDVTLSCIAPDGSVQVLGVSDVAQVAAAQTPPGGGVDGGQGGGALGVTGGPFQTLSIAVAVLLAAGAGFLVLGGRRRGQTA